MKNVKSLKMCCLSVGSALLTLTSGQLDPAFALPPTSPSAANAISAEAPVTGTDYQAAARLIGRNLNGLVLNDSVEPHWLSSSGRFWYRRDGAEGSEFVVVSPDGTKSPAFDHQRLAKAIMNVLKQGEAPLAKFTDVKLSDDLTHFSGRFVDWKIDCDLTEMQCKSFKSSNTDPSILLSPDGRQAAFIRENNLWVRDIKNGMERQITTEGTPLFSWGKWPDFAPGKRDPAVPFDTHWSPEGRYLITTKTDQRNVATWPIVEWVPSDGSKRPKVHEIRRALPGEAPAKLQYFVIDLQKALVTPIELPAAYGQPYASWSAGAVLGWSRRYNQVFFVMRSRGWKNAAVFRISLADASIGKVLEESSATRFEFNPDMFHSSNVRLIGDGSQILWYSDREGWGHIYLYDAQNGRMKRAVTSGYFSVNDVLDIDEKRREVYFTATGREKGRDPYYRHLYRASLDGKYPIRLLTEPNADHQFPVQPAPLFSFSNPAKPILSAASVFIDTWSTVDQPPVTALRSTRDGRIIAELERADASRLYEAGWTPPVRESVKAADGTTDLYAVYYAPQKQASSRSAPVIDVVYGGPNEVLAPRNFSEAWKCFGPRCRSPLTRLGFAALTVDARGTPFRSRAFRDAGYPEFTKIGIDDHIAAIKQLAVRHPEIDLNRIGVSGNSWGGTFAAQAILSYPDFFKVAVSGEGAYDYASLSYFPEPFIGPYDPSRGGLGNDQGIHSGWTNLDVTRLASRLKGKLLLYYSDLDENVPNAQIFRLIEGLTRANKPYDLIYLPGRDHGTGAGDRYTAKRTWDYFVEHLLGKIPPFDAAIRYDKP